MVSSPFALTTTATRKRFHQNDLTGTKRQHRTLAEHIECLGAKVMPRLMRDMLSLASCGGFVWMVWTVAISVSA
jgi:hypothetical protein